MARLAPEKKLPDFLPNFNYYSGENMTGDVKKIWIGLLFVKDVENLLNILVEIKPTARKNVIINNIIVKNVYVSFVVENLLLLAAVLVDFAVLIVVIKEK